MTGVSQPAPNLQSLTVDCDLGSEGPRKVDITRFEIPTALFAEGCKLRRLTVRGLPWQERLTHRLQELRSLTFANELAINSRIIDQLLEGCPNLCSLRLQCSVFEDHSPVEPPNGSIKQDFMRLKHVVLRNAKIADNHLFSSYFVQRGAPDVVAITRFIFVSQDTRDFLPNGVSDVSAGLSGISAHYLPSNSSPAQRVRIATDVLLSCSMSLPSVLKLIDRNSLTTLKIHEHAVSCILREPAGLLFYAWESTSFPALVELTVWLASWTEHHALVRFDDDPLMGIFTARQTPVNADLFPKLSTFVLSAGSSSNERTCSLQLPTPGHYIVPHEHQMACPCSNGYTVSLQDVRQFLVECNFPALETVRMCGVLCVDYDAAEALIELQRFVGDVQFEPRVVSCDIGTAPLEDLCAADEVFARLVTRE